MVVRLYPNVAPKMVERIKMLTRQHFYDGLKFHRVIDGFMAQTGDPKGDGTGGSTLPDMPAEFNWMPHVRGAVSAAREGAAPDADAATKTKAENSANSQFFIVLDPKLALDKKYTVFGRVISGMEYVDTVERGEPPANPSLILHAYIAADNPPAYTPAPPPAPVVLPAVTAVAPVPAPKPPRRGQGRRRRSRRREAKVTARRPERSAGRRIEVRMNVDLFDFDLPPERIALAPRSPARCGADAGGRWRCRSRDRLVGDLPSELRAGDLLVFNDTRVIPAQLEGKRGDAAIGATLHKREGPRRWRAFVRNARRLRDGDTIDFGAASARPRRIAARTAASRSISPATSRSNCCSNAAGGCRCRRISPRSARPMRATPTIIRRCSPTSPARSPRRPPRCISPPA